MKLVAMVHLDEAVLCMNCENISAPIKGKCACGSRALLNLKQALDRPAEVQNAAHTRILLRWRGQQVRAGG